MPSATHAGKYVVDPEAGTCMCPDFETRGGPGVAFKCKHLFAVEYVRHQVTEPDGKTTVTETMRVTYAQNWPAYNAAQTTEKEHVQRLLRGLCEGIVMPPQAKGRPRLPLSDVIFGCTMKVYVGMSGRRASTDIRECERSGHIDRAPHYNSLFSYLERPELTPLLKLLVEESAAPLKAVESNFAVDSTGFSTNVYRRWFDHKYGKEMKQATWIKAHAMVGCLTNVIASVEVTEGNENDSPQFPGLVKATAKRFALGDVTADKAYLGHENLAVVEACGGVPYVPFKSNSQGEGPAQWRRMWHLFSFERERFLVHYHQRSNVESTFSAIKRLFGASVRSKLLTAQINEVLLKVLAYNLTVLVHAIHGLGLEPMFWRPQAAAEVAS